jgi:hypothetical protein
MASGYPTREKSGGKLHHVFAFVTLKAMAIMEISNLSASSVSLLTFISQSTSFAVRK